jgi:hypothetical protein
METAGPKRWYLSSRLPNGVTTQMTVTLFMLIITNKMEVTEHACTAATLYTCTLEVLCQNLGRDTVYLDLWFSLIFAVRRGIWRDSASAHYRL